MFEIFMIPLRILVDMFQSLHIKGLEAKGYRYVPPCDRIRVDDPAYQRKK